MPAAVSVRTDFSAGELRRLAAATKNANQSRRLLSIAAVLDGMNRREAARIGGMDRQTLRDWVHRFKSVVLTGLRTPGPGATRPASRPMRRQNWPSSSRPARTGPCMASCAGDGPTSSASSPSASASSTTSARWARSCTSLASPTSAPARAIRPKTETPSPSSKKLRGDAERASRRRRQGQAGGDLVPG